MRAPTGVTNVTLKTAAWHVRTQRSSSTSLRLLGLSCWSCLACFIYATDMGNALIGKHRGNSNSHDRSVIAVSQGHSQTSLAVVAEKTLDLQDIENKLVPIKQACFIEQPDG